MVHNTDGGEQNVSNTSNGSDISHRRLHHSNNRFCSEISADAPAKTKKEEVLRMEMNSNH